MRMFDGRLLLVVRQPHRARRTSVLDSFLHHYVESQIVLESQPQISAMSADVKQAADENVLKTKSDDSQTNQIVDPQLGGLNSQGFRGRNYWVNLERSPLRAASTIIGVPPEPDFEHIFFTCHLTVS